MTQASTWICPTCRTPVTTPFCAECGERRLTARELTLGGLATEAAEALTNIDGRLLNSFRCLITRPGALTVAFLEGRRRPYLGPVALFLVANVIFFAIESLTGGLVFTTPLESHLNTQPWGPLAQVLVARRLADLQTTLDVYAPRFDAALALHARSLILVMAVAFGLLVAAVFRRGQRPFAAHAAFSLHLYAFMLLLFSIANTIPAAGVPFGAARSPSQLLDAILSISLVIACGVYLFVAIEKVYGWRGTPRLLAAVGLTVGVAAIVLAYRFALLLLTLYT